MRGAAMGRLGNSCRWGIRRLGAERAAAPFPVQSQPKSEVSVWILDSAVRRHRSCVHLRPAQARRRPGSRAGSPAAPLSTIAGVLPEADVARVRELCTGRVPEHARNQVRVELEQSRADRRSRSSNAGRRGGRTMGRSGLACGSPGCATWVRLACGRSTTTATLGLGVLPAARPDSSDRRAPR